jgi:hypothetical protein
VFTTTVSFQFRLWTKDKAERKEIYCPKQIAKLVSQLVSHFNVVFMHTSITLQVFQLQLHFNDKKFIGKVFPVLKWHDLEIVRFGVPKHFVTTARRML